MRRNEGSDTGLIKEPLSPFSRGRHDSLAVGNDFIISYQSACMGDRDLEVMQKYDLQDVLSTWEIKEVIVIVSEYKQCLTGMEEQSGLDTDACILTVIFPKMG